LPGGRGAGSEKIVPSWARAGGAAASAAAAIRAANPVNAMVRSIRRGTLEGESALDIVSEIGRATVGRSGTAPVNTLNTAGKGRLSTSFRDAPLRRRPRIPLFGPPP